MTVMIRKESKGQKDKPNEEEFKINKLRVSAGGS
jgi:hypothetical protein